MPELPEVQTIVNQLHPFLKDSVLEKTVVYDDKLKALNYNKLNNCKLEKISRIGKQIFLEFINNEGKDSPTTKKQYLAIHLRMTGVLIAKNSTVKNLTVKALNSSNILVNSEGKNSVNKKPRIIFNFKDKILEFYDVRRFGTVEIFNQIPTKFSKIADPLLPIFTIEYLTSILGSSKQLKVLLLDQSKILGIGNIYASEILYDAKLNPFTKANSLTSEEIKRLHKSIIKILELAIKMNGTTFSDYQDSTGKKGGFQNFLKVYGREDKFCFKCKNVIIVAKQAQRSTFYCKNCQL